MQDTPRMSVAGTFYDMWQTCDHDHSIRIHRVIIDVHCFGLGLFLNTPMIHTYFIPSVRPGNRLRLLCGGKRFKICFFFVRCMITMIKNVYQNKRKTNYKLQATKPVSLYRESTFKANLFELSLGETAVSRSWAFRLAEISSVSSKLFKN